MKALYTIRWAATFLFAGLAFLNLCAGDLGSVFYIVLALVALPYPAYQMAIRKMFPSKSIRALVAVAAVLLSIAVQPGFREAKWKPEEPTSYNIGYKIGSTVYDITKVRKHQPAQSDQKETKSTEQTYAGKPEAENSQKTAYKSGQYKVGVDIPAGQYMLIANEKYSAYFALTTDANGKDIICNDNFDNNSMVEVYDGEFLEIKRCYAVPLDTVDGVTTENGYLQEGMYIVGKHIAPGEYKVESTEKYSGYYCIYSDLRHDDIVANNNFDGSCYVELTDGQYFQLNRAKIYIGE